MLPFPFIDFLRFFPIKSIIFRHSPCLNGSWWIIGIFIIFPRWGDFRSRYSVIMSCYWISSFYVFCFRHRRFLLPWLALPSLLIDVILRHCSFSCNLDVTRLSLSRSPFYHGVHPTSLSSKSVCLCDQLIQSMRYHFRRQLMSVDFLAQRKNLPFFLLLVGSRNLKIFVLLGVLYIWK